MSFFTNNDPVFKKCKVIDYLTTFFSPIFFHKMFCSKCVKFMEDKKQVDHNIRDIRRYISVTEGLQNSLDKTERLYILKKHFNSNTRVLEDLILILYVDCQECLRKGSYISSIFLHIIFK